MTVASVFDVAKYVLKHTGQTTTMKLQKLVYYCQAWSLAWDGKPLFPEEFRAWANGPVCKELYERHRGQFIVDESLFANIPDYNFDKDEIETMDVVLKDYGNKEPQWLSDLTHKERPWKETREGLKPGERGNKVIPKELMQDYYGGLIGG